MPSISQRSWGSEVHFPYLIAGLKRWGLLGPDWETACTWAPWSPLESWVSPGTQGSGHQPTSGCLSEGGKIESFFGGRAHIGTGWTLQCGRNCGQHVIEECLANRCPVGAVWKVTPHCSLALPPEPSCIWESLQRTISFNTFSQLIGCKLGFALWLLGYRDFHIRKVGSLLPFGSTL